MEAHVQFYAVKHGEMHAPKNKGVRFPVKMEPMRSRLIHLDAHGRSALHRGRSGGSETFATVANLVQHIRYYQFSERHELLPIVGSHQELDVEALFKERSIDRIMTVKVIDKEGREATVADARIDIGRGPRPFCDEFQRCYKRVNVEIICVVEAIDPILSETSHAVQTYTIDGIVCDAELAPCVLAYVSAMN